MRTLIMIACLTFFTACSSSSNKHLIDNSNNEMSTVEDIIFLRTAGLIYLDKLMDATISDQDKLANYANLFNYYKDSQLELVDLCKGRALNLHAEDYDTIEKQIKEDDLQAYATNVDTIKDKIIGNLEDQKMIYLQLISNEEYADLRLFALDSYVQVYAMIEEIK